jgi:hypothetical protein
MKHEMLEDGGGSTATMASIVGPVGFASAPAYTFRPRTTSTAQRARP